MYAMVITRPDIAYTTNTLGRFLMNPSEQHLSAATRVVQYIRHTRDHSITYSGSGDSVGYTDASYASCPDTRKSVSGYIFYFASGPISWKSRRQPCVALSSTEAEYIALVEAGKEAVWLNNLLRSIRALILADHPPKIHLRSDSTSAISLTENSVFHERTKHIDVRYHWLREKVKKGEIKVNHISGENLVADGLNEAIGEDKVCEVCEIARTGSKLLRGVLRFEILGTPYT